VKVSVRTLLKIARLYGVADDNTSVKDLRHLDTAAEESFTRSTFTLNKQKYAILFGSAVDMEDLDELWPQRPRTAEPLANPLDKLSVETPFQGKFAVMFYIPPEKQRLDIFLSTDFDSSLSRSLWQKYIKDGRVSVNGKVIAQPKYEVSYADDIAVSFPDTPNNDSDVPVIYEDEDVIVANKPSGLLTHAKGGITTEQTLAETFRQKTTFAVDSTRPGIVHRLDRDTSGIIILARHDSAAHDLQQQFARRTAKKTYLAVVSGTPKHEKALIDLPIARNPRQPSTFTVDPKGKPAQTYYEVLASDGEKSLLLLQPKTGRTHQLRVHLKQIGTPICGDIVYGKAGQRLMLHAWKLDICLPSGERKEFVAPIPSIFLDDFPEVSL